MQTGPLNPKTLESMANALRSRLTGKPPEQPAAPASTGGLASDASEVSGQDARYRAWEQAQPQDPAAAYATPPAEAQRVMSTGASWLSGRTLQNILGAVKRHLGGSIPPGTTITIRPRPGGRPGEYAVSVRLGGSTRPAPAPTPMPKPMPVPAPPLGGRDVPTPMPKPTPVPAPEVAPPVRGGGGTPNVPPTAPGDVRGLLASPLPELPGPAAGSSWSQNDLKNRAEVTKALRADPGVQAALQNWNQLSESDRMQAAQRMSAIMGEVYGFTPFNVGIDRSLQGTSTQGYFSPSQNKIAISPSLLQNPREFVNTVIHEQAHAYQHEKAQAASRGTMSPNDPLYQTARTWGQNFANYVSGGNYQAYRSQPIEAHAFATGEAISAGVFS